MKDTNNKETGNFTIATGKDIVSVAIADEMKKS